MIADAVPPGLILILAVVPAVLLRGRLRQAWMLLVPALSLLNMLALPEGNHFLLPFFRQELVLARVDRLSVVFGIIFHIIAFIANLYALKVEDRFQNAAALVYAGAAVGAVFAGDLFTLFVFWEMMTLGATFLIMARRTEKSMAAGFRYFMVHVVSGLCLLGGILLQVQNTGTVAFGYIGLGTLSSWLIFIGFGVNSAWPLLHFCLPDAYPESTVTGAVFLSAWTTQTAVYVLARAYPGTEALIWIGAAMTVFPIFFAVIENNLRRVLSYSLINQVGFMMVGIGIGTQLSLNGTVSHAFSHILYKALLFMSMGAVLFRTGKINARPGRAVPVHAWTCTFCVVGRPPSRPSRCSAGSSASPWSWRRLRSATCACLVHAALRLGGVFHHAGIKVPFFAFLPTIRAFAARKRRGTCCWRWAWPRRSASASACSRGPLQPAALCDEYRPYEAGHVISQTQLLFFSALAFTLLLLAGVYPAEIAREPRRRHPDAQGRPRLLTAGGPRLNALNDWADEVISHRLTRRLALFSGCRLQLQRLGFRALAYFTATTVDEGEDVCSEARCETGGNRRRGVLRAVLLLTILTILVLAW
jgi:multicomponent Na+:H+ antiporter subunit D